MMQQLEVLEPQRRPARRTIQVETGGTVAIHALPAMSGGIEGLRRTILRRQGEAAPAEAVLVLLVRVDVGGLVAVEVSSAVVLELDRNGVRRQVVSGMRLPAQGAYELSLPDQSRATFLIQTDQGLERGASFSVAGSGTRKSRVRSADESTWWILNDAPDLLGRSATIVRDYVTDKLKSLGINQEVLTFFTGVLISAVILGGVAYWQWSARRAAEEQQAQLAEQLALAESAQAASVASQLACLDDRQALVAELGREQEARNLKAEAALGLALTRQSALELGGLRMGTVAVRKTDALLEPTLVASVLGRMSTVDISADPASCLAQASVLGTDLPRYLLLWQSDLTVNCPVGYASEDGGTRRTGRWGLSDRIAAEFTSAGNTGIGTSSEALAEVVADPRVEDRWSAFAVASAYRRALETVLETRRTERPPALPAQAHLWALAFLDAYNRLPSAAGGALDTTIDVCVDRVLIELSATAQPAAPGTSLLPDITAVSGGAVKLRPTPTPGCAWPQDVFVEATTSALHAVARLAVLEAQNDPEDAK